MIKKFMTFDSTKKIYIQINDKGHLLFCLKPAGSVSAEGQQASAALPELTPKEHR